jgi:hypothetical protein
MRRVGGDRMRRERQKGKIRIGICETMYRTTRGDADRLECMHALALNIAKYRQVDCKCIAPDELDSFDSSSATEVERETVRYSLEVHKMQMQEHCKGRDTQNGDSLT